VIKVLFSARKSYLDLIVNSIGLTAIPRYKNLQSKVTYSLGNNHTLLWNTVFGSDTIRIEPEEGEDADWGEDDNVDQATDLLITGLTLKSILGKSLFSETVISHVRNSWSTDVWKPGVSRSDAFYNNRSIESETNLKYDLVWLMGKHELSGGFSLKTAVLTIIFLPTGTPCLCTIPLLIPHRKTPLQTYSKYTRNGATGKIQIHGNELYIHNFV